MGKDNLMGLFETQDYISSGKHEWSVPTRAKDKVAKMVQKYNAKATKKNYGDSLFEFDEASSTLSGIFVPKGGNKSFWESLSDGANNGDLCGDIQDILRLCTKVCSQCGKEIPALTIVCECGKQQFVKGQTEGVTNMQTGKEALEENDGQINNHTSDSAMPDTTPQENIYWEEGTNGIIKCPKCGCEMSSKSESCPLCGTKVVLRAQIETPSQSEPQKEEISQPIQPSQEKVESVESEPLFAKEEIGVKYKKFESRMPIELPQGITYYDDILTHLKKYIEVQKKRPKSEVVYLLALDLDKLNLADEETLDDDDPRLGINSFDICNVFFSKYNDWQPLFEGKVNNGQPQIFVMIKDWQADLKKVAELATKFCISFAMEKGFDKSDKEYERIILSFDDDVEATAKFMCYMATIMLNVPKDIPVDINISSYQTKAKAQKEYKKANTFSAMDYARGARLFIKDKITGK